MTNELVNEITKYLDEHICPEDKIKDFDFCVYIWSKRMAMAKLFLKNTRVQSQGILYGL